MSDKKDGGAAFIHVLSLGACLIILMSVLTFRKLYEKANADIQNPIELRKINDTLKDIQESLSTQRRGLQK